MIAVSDTSVVNYLVLIGEVDCLRELFTRVVLPPAVEAELSHEATPPAVRDWMLARPDWVDVRAVSLPLVVNEPLGAAELDAISLAAELGALLLMDDFAARAVATGHGIPVAGTLGVLERAAARGTLSLPEALDKLRATTFRLSDALIEAALERDRRRRNP